MATENTDSETGGTGKAGTGKAGAEKAAPRRRRRLYDPPEDAAAETTAEAAPTRAEEPAETKARGRKAPARKAAAKKATTRKTPTKKAAAKKATAKPTPAKKAPAKKAPAKKAPARKAPAEKTPARKTARAESDAEKAAARTVAAGTAAAGAGKATAGQAEGGEGGAAFDGADFDGADFDGADLDRKDLGGADFDGPRAATPTALALRARRSSPPPTAESRHQEAQVIIERGALMSAGLTLMMPIPVADLAGATLIQIDMLAGLAENYRINFYEQRQKTYLAALVGAALPISAYRFLSSGIKVIPVVGPLTAAFFLPAMVGGATYATGRIFARHFAQGGDLLDFEADQWRRYGEEQYAKGRAFVTDLVKSDRSKVIEAGTRAAAT